MKFLTVIVTSALVIASGGLAASASTELDKAMGAGSFIHPTGPVHGVWDDEYGRYRN